MHGRGHGHAGREDRLCEPGDGPLAGFGEADKFVIGALNAKFKEGIDIGGDKRTIEVLIRDSQSDSNRAASVVNDLILNTGVNRPLSPEPPALSAPSASHSPLGLTAVAMLSSRRPPRCCIGAT